MSQGPGSTVLPGCSRKNRGSGNTEPVRPAHRERETQAESHRGGCAEAGGRWQPAEGSGSSLWAGGAATPGLRHFRKCFRKMPHEGRAAALTSGRPVSSTQPAQPCGAALPGSVWRAAGAWSWRRCREVKASTCEDPAQNTPHRKKAHLSPRHRRPFITCRTGRKAPVICGGCAESRMPGNQATCPPAFSLAPTPAQEEQDGEQRLGLRLDRPWGCPARLEGPPGLTHLPDLLLLQL